ARLRPCPGGRVRAARGRVSGRVRLVVLVVGGDDAVSFGQLAQHVVVGRELIAEARVLVAVEAAGVPLVLFRPLDGQDDDHTQQGQLSSGPGDAAGEVLFGGDVEP